MAKLKAETEEVVKITPEQVKIIEKTIETQLAVVGVTDQQITQWEEEFKALKIDGIEDKDGYAKVYESRQKAKKTRILIKDVCEAGRAPLIAETKEWIVRQKNYVARMESIEEYLQSQEDTVDAEKDRIKAEKAAKILERYKERVKKLTDLGAMWDGSHYILDELSYSGETLRETEDDFFNNKIVPQYKAIFDAKAAIAKANKEAQELLEAQQKKIADDLKQQTEELQRQQDQLKKDQETIEQQKREAQVAAERENARIEREKQEACKAMVEKRNQQLINIGLTYDWGKKTFFLRDIIVTNSEVENEPDDKWELILEDAKSNIAIIKAKIKEEADAELDRLNKIAIEKANALREQEAEQRRQQEREDLEKGKDSDRWRIFLKTINVEIPIMHSRQYITMAAETKKLLDQIREMKVPK